MAHPAEILSVAREARRVFYFFFFGVGGSSRRSVRGGGARFRLRFRFCPLPARNLLDERFHPVDDRRGVEIGAVIAFVVAVAAVCSFSAGAFLASLLRVLLPRLLPPQLPLGLRRLPRLGLEESNQELVLVAAPLAAAALARGGRSGGRSCPEPADGALAPGGDRGLPRGQQRLRVDSFSEVLQNRRHAQSRDGSGGRRRGG